MTLLQTALSEQSLSPFRNRQVVPQVLEKSGAVLVESIPRHPNILISHPNKRAWRIRQQAERERWKGLVPMFSSNTLAKVIWDRLKQIKGSN